MFGVFNCRNSDKNLESEINGVSSPRKNNPEDDNSHLKENPYGFSKSGNYSNSAFVEIKKPRKSTSINTASSKPHEDLNSQNTNFFGNSTDNMLKTKKKIKKSFNKGLLDVGERDRVKTRVRRSTNQFETSFANSLGTEESSGRETTGPSVKINSNFERNQMDPEYTKN